MALKNITIRKEAYDYLVSLKLPGESFSDLITLKWGKNKAAATSYSEHLFTVPQRSPER
jgi:predicted CopG family antitoxin